MRQAWPVALLLAASAGAAGCIFAEDAVHPAPEWRPGHRWTWVVAGTGEEASLELLGPAQRFGLQGFDGVAGGQFPALLFGSPGSMHLAKLMAAGGVEDICRDPSAYGRHQRPPDGPPLLPFPLHEGSEVKAVVLDLGDSRRIQGYSIGALGSVTTPAGTFDAVRVEVRAWTEWDDPEMAEAFAGSEIWPSEDDAKRQPALATLFYAPAARHVVRLEASNPIHDPLPGVVTDFAWGKPAARPAVMVELAQLSLQEVPALEGPERPARAVLGTMFEDDCAGLDQEGAVEAGLPAPSTGFEPAASEFSSPGATVTWDVRLPSPRATYTWRLETANGALVDAGSGPSWSATMEKPGAYRVVLAASRDGTVVENRGHVLVHQRLEGSFDCDPVVADGLVTTFGGSGSDLPACEPLEVEVGPGDAILVATVEHGPEGRVPCSHLDLFDPAGTDRGSVFSDGERARLEALVTGPGTWSLRWHPGAQGPVAPDYDVALQYLPPDGGYGWGGPGSPGC